MSDTFFHLLGPGTQPDDDSFSMNPLPSPAVSTATPAWHHWKTARTVRR
jgi:hydrogenase-1 operon protein HyaF